MKKIFLILMILIAGQNLFSQDDMMKKWMDYMTPGKEHEMLAKWAGDWTFTITMWMTPDAPPQKSEGTMKGEMLLGNRYFQSKHSGNFMGMPFEGISLIGYDNAKKVFVSSWIDNMGTGLMYSEGTYDAATKKTTYFGKIVDPMSGKEEKFKQVFIHTDDNNFTMENYMFDKDGKEYKSMESVYKKK